MIVLYIKAWLVWYSAGSSSWSIVLRRLAVNHYALQWRHNEHDSIANHRRLRYLPNCCCRRRSKKASHLYVTGLCEGNSRVTREFPTQKASNAENTSIRWRHHGDVIHLTYIHQSFHWYWMSYLTPLCWSEIWQFTSVCILFVAIISDVNGSFGLPICMNITHGHSAHSVITKIIYG